MKQRLCAAIIWFAAGVANADGWSEPAQRSSLRTALLDALRPQAEWVHGRPSSLWSRT